MPSGKVENFKLRDQHGNEFELYKNLDKKVLLIFYPKDKSLVCSRQLNNYQKNIHLFEAAGIRPIAINIESSSSHNAFCSQLGLDFPVLSDKDKKISKKFKALNLFSVNKRKLVLIDTGGEVVYERIIPSFKYDTVDRILTDLRNREII